MLVRIQLPAGIMTEKEAKETAETLALMAEAERAMAVLYESCARVDTDRAEVWRRIAAAERRHAEGVDTMGAILVRMQGDGFRIGRTFSRDAIQAFIEQVRKNDADVKAGELKGRVLFMVTRGLETAILEDRFFEFVTTKDEDFRRLVDRITAETREHQRLMHAWVAAAGA